MGDGLQERKENPSFPLGKQVEAKGSVLRQHLDRRVSGRGYRRGRICRNLAGGVLSSDGERIEEHDRECVGVDGRLVGDPAPSRGSGQPDRSSSRD